MHCALAVTVCGLLLAAWTSVAQEEPAKGTGDVIKEKADAAVKTLRKGVGAAEEGIKGTFAHARTAAINMGLHGRVYARLHWDKALANAKIETEVSNSVVTLRGTVPDAKAKAKAVELTNDTIGVNEVIDQLTIAIPPEPKPARGTQP